MIVYHWVPADGRPQWSCIESWMNLMPPPGSQRIFKPTMPGSVRMVWNNTVREMLKTKAEWMFSTHMDITFDPETLVRLLSWNQPIVSALVFMKTVPAVPQLWKPKEDRYEMQNEEVRQWFYKHKDWIRKGPFVMDPRPDDALSTIGFCATACTIIHRQVFEDIRNKIPGQGEGWWFVHDNELTGGGEDRRFYEYARAVGYQPYVDRSCVAAHGENQTSSFDFIFSDLLAHFSDTSAFNAGKDCWEQLKAKVMELV